MSWLISQIWVWMAVSALLGAATTTLFMTTRVGVERWVEVLVEEIGEAFAAAEPEAPEPVEEQPDAAREVLADTRSPFPPLPGHHPDDRPWEAEELWSRPARVDGTGRPRTSTDAWSDAAAHWRDWADEALQRTSDASAADDDDNLFAADREAERLGLEAGVFSTSLLSLQGRSVADEPASSIQDADERLPERGHDDDFPYAQPVEAPYPDNVELFPLTREDRRSA